MGLAGPRKRLKIAHDPRNLQWSSVDSSQSFGKRLMQQQGWQQGQALGLRPSSVYKSTTDIDNARLAAANVGVMIKDDTLGLGAQLKSKDVQHQKTGLDAFQGLLGRLNSKTEEEVKAVERKEESRKLEMYARGRWGGMVFVRGGVLVQGEEFKKADAEKKIKEPEVDANQGEKQEQRLMAQGVDNEKKRRKEEKRRHKEEKHARKVARAAAREMPSQQESKTKASPSRTLSLSAPDEPKSSDDEKSATQPPKEQPRKRRRSSVIAEEAIKKQALNLKNGRHILRGRNIEAKRKAFSDMKGLDAIFMKTR